MPDASREIAELLLAAGLGSGATGFWGWIQKRTSNRAENKTGEAAILAAATRLQEVMNEAAKNTVADLRNQLDEVRQEAERLRERVDQLEGENRAMRQREESLEQLLRRQGIDIPGATAPGALLVVQDGVATVMKPERMRP
jgi:TolA-binding protein